MIPNVSHYIQDGMLRMYNIGQWIRTEYGSIIGNTYDSTLSLTQSSYADRCIMSAQVLLAGLYPPTNEEIFVSGLTWRPVPVHSTPRNLDKVYIRYWNITKPYIYIYIYHLLAYTYIYDVC